MADNNNHGTISKNTNKTKENHPDIRGKCIVDGVEYWLAGWLKQNANGSYYSLAFTPKEDASSNGRRIVNDADIPF